MTVRRMDNVGIVFQDLEAAIAFFVELGLEVEGRTQVSGEFADQCVGIEGIRCDIAMLRTPDGNSRLELSRYVTPAALEAPLKQPHNTIGMHRVMFAVDGLEEVIDRLGKHGAEILGSIARYEDSYLLAYVRGPEGIIVGLAEQLS